MAGLVPAIPLRMAQRQLNRDHRDAALRAGPVMTWLVSKWPPSHCSENRMGALKLRESPAISAGKRGSGCARCSIASPS